MVTGLEMSRSYFFEWGLPLLRERFPELPARMAAGIWRGSQIFGADDVLSRDHGWGAMFTLLLGEADYSALGPQIEATLKAHAPAAWQGVATPSDAGVLLTSVDQFFEDSMGLTTAPDDAAQWLAGFHLRFGTRESELYLIRHGHVFHDPSDLFTTRRA
jgi:hypothetical protein